MFPVPHFQRPRTDKLASSTSHMGRQLAYRHIPMNLNRASGSNGHRTTSLHVPITKRRRPRYKHRQNLLLAAQSLSVERGSRWCQFNQ